MDFDLDDSDDEKKATTRRAPSRVVRHAPRSSKPKTEPQPSSVPKAEPVAAVTAKHEVESVTDAMEVEESKPSVVMAEAKSEEETAIVDSDVSIQAEPMEEDKEDEEAEAEEDEDEEDMIVREIDVYFNPLIDDKTQLYLLQYPLRPCWRPYELEERCEEVRVKTSTAQVQIDLSLDLQSNCDSEVAKKMNMTKQTLASTWNPPQASGCAVGILKDNELYLNPIQAVVQLRPSMDHLKAGGSKRKGNTTNAEIKLEDATDSKSASSSKKLPKQKESTDKKIEDNEGWVSLKYHGQTSDFSENYLQRMAVKEKTPLQFTVKPSLLSLPLEERIKKLLSEEPLFHRFSALKHFAPDSSIEDVLETVQKHALLVQGLWTPKTYPLPAEIRDNFVRDYILLRFRQNTVFSLENCDLPSSNNYRKHAKLILPFVAVERALLKDWKFKVDPDASFIKQYPDIINRQNDVWNKIAVVINKRVTPDQSKKNVTRKPENTSALAPESDKGAKQSGGSASDGPRSGKKMSDETREALPLALKKVFQTYKVCSFQLINQGLRNLSVSEASRPKPDSKILNAASHGVDASPQEFLEVLNEIALNIHGVYVLKSSMENPEHDPLRKVVIDLLSGKPANAQLKKTEVIEAAKIKLKREISSNEYTKADSNTIPNTPNSFCDLYLTSRRILCFLRSWVRFANPKALHGS
ncbi:hypothetical protein ACFE04_021932 [Oxalis oulophora]